MESRSSKCIALSLHRNFVSNLFKDPNQIITSTFMLFTAVYVHSIMKQKPKKIKSKYFIIIKKKFNEYKLNSEVYL